MTGNDIVDIKIAAAESNWKRKGFLEKIFTPQEQQYINESATPDKMVWRLWSMKESAYKIYVRQYGGRFFSPQAFSCCLLSKTAGIVEYKDCIYQTKTKITSSYIHTVANKLNAETSQTIVKCFRPGILKYSHQQQFIYTKIIESFCTSCKDFNRKVSVEKDKNGIPFLYCGNNLQIPLSITHHGNFAAFTIN